MLKKNSRTSIFNNGIAALSTAHSPPSSEMDGHLHLQRKGRRRIVAVVTNLFCCSIESLICLPNQSIQCSKDVHDRGSKTCDVFSKNSVTGVLARGDLVEDIVAVRPVDVDRFLLACAPSFLLQGLASGAKGMLGLGRIRLSQLSQLAASVE
ncbi:hypothetical protein LWI28_018195 [Acer negundo]|uniref:Xylanase inhibitor N-terminal domain-containing protein n=1 Tax=Acer negundo TaxID=4023 RepID=A0AAD5NVI3_ACENE|nr:hypothetical protein LWI28_018195 [Acer negundo]